jgi:hypothetical protein
VAVLLIIVAGVGYAMPLVGDGALYECCGQPRAAATATPDYDAPRATPTPDYSLPRATPDYDAPRPPAPDYDAPRGNR